MKKKLTPDPNPLDFDSKETYTAAVKAHNEAAQASAEVENNSPTLFDLIAEHFPEPYRTAYNDPWTICRELRALCRFNAADSCLGANPPGSESYWWRCQVHEEVERLRKVHPDWQNKDFLEHIRKRKVGNKAVPFDDKQVSKWIAEVYASPRGRPKGAKKLTLK